MLLYGLLLDVVHNKDSVYSWKRVFTMNRNGWAAFCTGVVFSFCIAFFILYTSNSQNPTQLRQAASTMSCDTVCGSYKLLRDQLSRQLNNMKKEYGQLNCEMNKMLKKQLVTSAGGWCKADSSPTSSHHRTDYKLAKRLATFFKGKSVASLGDGPGLYKQFFDKTGLLGVYDAYDGAPYCEEVTKGVVKFLDLTAPQYGLPVYDWVMSMEVAEHIPAKYESVYVDNLVRHAEEGILLSWAVPGQGGHSHVNGKSFKDVKTLMSNLGFELDETTSKIIKSNATLPWLRSNINIFRRMNKVELSTTA